MPVVTLLNAVSANTTGPAVGLGGAYGTTTLAVSTKGTVSAFSVQLQGSLDGVNWANVGSAVTSTTAGTSVGTGVLFQYFQATLSGYSGTGKVTCVLAYSLETSASGGGGPPTGAAGGDLGSTYPNPTVTVTHLASPLPVAQGGTAAASAGAALTSLGALAAASNLSDVSSASTSRTNLGLGTAATLASSAVAQTANNLSDLASASTALTNLGALPVAGGTMSGAIAMGAHKITGLTNGSASSDAAALGQVVNSISATDTSIVVTGGSGTTPTVATNTLDVIAAQHPAAANWSNNSKKITGLAKGASATDAATIGQASMYSASVARYSGVSGQAPREAFPYWAATGNQAVTAGVMYLALLPVCPGDVITNVGFVTGTTGATFGSSGYHWWTALYDNTAAFIAQSADQTNTAIASGHAYLLALGSPAPYTVPANVTYLYAAVMINTGTGGSPVQPTLRGPSQNTALVDSTTSLWPTAAIASATNGSSLGASAPTGTITLAASANLQYLGAS